MKSVFAVNATVHGLTLQLAGAANNLRAHGGHSTSAAMFLEHQGHGLTGPQATPQRRARQQPAAPPLILEQQLQMR